MLDDRDPEASGLGWDQQHPVDVDVEHGLQRTDRRLFLRVER